MFARKRPKKLSVDEHDPRTVLVVDRLEAVADRIDDLATQMEARLNMPPGGREDEDHARP